MKRFILNIVGAVIAITFLVMTILSWKSKSMTSKLKSLCPELDAIDSNERDFFETNQNLSPSSIFEINLYATYRKSHTVCCRHLMFTNFDIRVNSKEISNIDRNDEIISTRGTICPPNYSPMTGSKFCFLIGNWRTQGELLHLIGYISPFIE